MSEMHRLNATIWKRKKPDWAAFATDAKHFISGNRSVSSSFMAFNVVLVICSDDCQPRRSDFQWCCKGYVILSTVYHRHCKVYFARAATNASRTECKCGTIMSAEPFLYMHDIENKAITVY